MRIFISNHISGQFETSEEFHHIVQVMRNRVNDIIECVSNGVWQCKIIKIKKNSIILEPIKLLSTLSIQQRFSLAFANIRPCRVEHILEKCTEIGITDFYPIITERVQYKSLSYERSMRIIKSAAAQSLKMQLPRIHNIQTLTRLSLDNTWVIASCDATERNINSATTNILIGPEGGWSKEEKEYCISKEVQTLSLGSSILRAETACIVASWQIVNKF